MRCRWQTRPRLPCWRTQSVPYGARTSLPFSWDTPSCKQALDVSSRVLFLRPQWNKKIPSWWAEMPTLSSTASFSKGLCWQSASKWSWSAETSKHSPGKDDAARDTHTLQSQKLIVMEINLIQRVKQHCFHQWSQQQIISNHLQGQRIIHLHCFHSIRKGKRKAVEQTIQSNTDQVDFPVRFSNFLHFNLLKVQFEYGPKNIPLIPDQIILVNFWVLEHDRTLLKIRKSS